MTGLLGPRQDSGGEEMIMNTVATLAIPPAIKGNCYFDRDRVVNLLIFYVADSHLDDCQRGRESQGPSPQSLAVQTPSDLDASITILEILFDAPEFQSDSENGGTCPSHPPAPPWLGADFEFAAAEYDDFENFINWDGGEDGTP